MDLVLIVHKDPAVRETLAAALSDASCGTLAVDVMDAGHKKSLWRTADKI